VRRLAAVDPAGRQALLDFSQVGRPQGCAWGPEAACLPASSSACLPTCHLSSVLSNGCR
jgi:hypothetical protein